MQIGYHTDSGCNNLLGGDKRMTDSKTWQWQDMDAQALILDLIRLNKERPVCKSSIRDVQAEMEKRYDEENAKSNPSIQLLEKLKGYIEGIDTSAITDYGEYGTASWRAKHPWKPSPDDK